MRFNFLENCIVKYPVLWWWKHREYNVRMWCVLNTAFYERRGRFFLRYKNCSRRCNLSFLFMESGNWTYLEIKRFLELAISKNHDKPQVFLEFNQISAIINFKRSQIFTRWGNLINIINNQRFDIKYLTLNISSWSQCTYSHCNVSNNLSFTDYRPLNDWGDYIKLNRKILVGHWQTGGSRKMCFLSIEKMLRTLWLYGKICLLIKLQ